MIRSAVRWLGITGVAVALVCLCLHHGHSGAKGRCVPIPNMAFCILTSSVAAFLCKRYWLVFFSPFVAGVVGGLCVGYWLDSPFGCVVGLVVGMLVMLIPFGRSEAAQRRV